jgi:GT2 family glycosyltransferase
MMSPYPSWALVIATYQRADVLRKSISVAIRQDPPPNEVIVVDASPDALESRQNISGLLADRPDITLRYERARVASITQQRNQGLDLAESEIVFLFDDDTFMYPDCARAILEVYANDVRAEIAGVTTDAVDAPPQQADLAGQAKRDAPTEKVGFSANPILRKLQLFIWRELLLMGADKFFVPYDSHYYRHPVSLPEYCSQVDLFFGFNMTYRRSFLEKERFEDAMLRYSPGEDVDLSYRVSRHGALVRTSRAKVHHYGSASGRLRRFEVTALRTLNQAYCVGKHGGRRAKVVFAVSIARQIIAESIKDMSQSRLDFPQLRGTIFAARHTYRLLNASEYDRLALFRKLQDELLNRRGG